MAKKQSLRGGDLMVFVGGVCYPLATQCSVQANLSMLDPQTKDDSIYETPDEDSKKWNVSATNQSDEAFETFVTVLALAKAHTRAAVKVGKPANLTHNGVPAGGWTAPTKYLNGTAYVSQVTFDAPVNGKATVAIQLTGASDLTKEESV